MAPLPPGIPHGGGNSGNRPSLSDPSSYGPGSFPLGAGSSSPHNHSSGGSGGNHRSSFGGSRPTIESIIDARRANNPHEVCFTVPKIAVGAVIGKGGQNLKELQNQFGVRVFIEKEDFNGKRLVVLSPSGDSAGNAESERVLTECRNHIEGIVEEHIKSRSTDEFPTSTD
jgi:hypothetical protein